MVNSEARIGSDYSIAPKAILEMGLSYLETKDLDSAKKWLNKAIDDYSGYLYENYVHLRAYGGLRASGVSCDKKNEAKRMFDHGDYLLIIRWLFSLGKNYKKQWLKEIDVEEDKYEKIVEIEEQLVF